MARTAHSNRNPKLTARHSRGGRLDVSPGWPSRVLVVTTWYPSPEAPGEAPFCRQHAELIARGAQVQVMHIRLGSSLPDSDEVDGPIRVHHRSLRPREPGTIWRVRRDIARYARGADLVHTMAFSSALIQALAIPRAAWVHTEHWNGVRTPEQEGGWWPKVAFLRHVLRLTDCATGVTSDLTEVLTRFTRPGCAVQVPCEVAVPAHIAPLPDGPTLPMAAIGWLIERKDPLLAVRTLALVRERGIDASLTWIGAGPLADQASALAGELGIGGHFHLTGALPQAEAIGRLADARLFFLPSRHENFFTSAAEALGAGRPVVVGATGGHGEYICAANGILVADHRPEAYADAIEEMYGRLEAGQFDPATLSADIERRYGPDAVAATIAQAYDVARRERDRGWRLARAAFSLLQRSAQ